MASSIWIQDLAFSEEAVNAPRHLASAIALAKEPNLGFMPQPLDLK
jgi:hypothetical protein